jgi:hypothetical protein
MQIVCDTSMSKPFMELLEHFLHDAARVVSY